MFTGLMASMDDDSDKLYRDRKKKLLSSLGRRVVELGPGTGLNLRFLDRGTEWIGIEPNPAMHSRILQRAEGLELTIDLRSTTLERSGLDDGSADAVVSTMVLCSVASVETLLSQVLRVLKPGGRFVFLEHVADRPGSFRRLVQKTMPYTPWRYFSDGCDPGRDIGDAIRAAGFERVECESYLQDGTGLILAINRPHIAGFAFKGARG
jgi:SAM-dependent methyltransferase